MNLPHPVVMLTLSVAKGKHLGPAWEATHNRPQSVHPAVKSAAHPPCQRIL